MWSWSSNTLATCCKEPTHWERSWCWETVKVGGEGDDRGYGWWHHWLDGRECELTPGDGDWQESLVGSSPWGHRESDMPETEVTGWASEGRLLPQAGLKAVWLPSEADREAWGPQQDTEQQHWAADWTSLPCRGPASGFCTRASHAFCRDPQLGTCTRPSGFLLSTQRDLLLFSLVNKSLTKTSVSRQQLICMGMPWQVHRQNGYAQRATDGHTERNHENKIGHGEQRWGIGNDIWPRASNTDMRVWAWKVDHVISEMCLYVYDERESEVIQSFLTLFESVNCRPPGSSVHGMLQARILEWVIISFSRGIFPTQGSNPGLLHCRQMLCSLSHQMERE